VAGLTKGMIADVHKIRRGSTYSYDEGRWSKSASGG